MKLGDLEIDQIFFTEAVPMIPLPGQNYLAQSAQVRLKNDGRHERLEVIEIMGQPFLRRTSLQDDSRVMTMHLANPQIKMIMWRRKTVTEKYRRK